MKNGMDLDHKIKSRVCYLGKGKDSEQAKLPGRPEYLGSSRYSSWFGTLGTWEMI